MSSLEVARWALGALAADGSRYNAVAELVADRAEAEARRADAERARGRVRSPLHGIPYGVKDVIAAKGTHTRWGAEPYRDQLIDEDATVVARMRDAGAVLVAKLAPVALAGAGLYRSTSASLHGPGLNPWDPTRWSGGSSSGAASVIAAGILPIALGTETRGSIVIPSAFCGITGLRPTYGLVSRYGVMPAAWSMDKVGPMTRSSDDCKLVLGVIQGIDPLDPTTVARPPGRPRGRPARAGVLPFESTDAEVGRRFAEALTCLRGLGMRTSRVALPAIDYRAISQTIVAAETAASHEALIRSPRLDELSDEGQRRGLRSYLDVPLTDYVRALERRAEATRALDALFRKVDVLVAPTVPFEAPPIDVDLATVPRLGYAVLGAVAGVPAVTVPMGFGGDGLPLGLTIIAPRSEDLLALAIASSFQRTTDWHTRRPEERGPK